MKEELLVNLRLACRSRGFVFCIWIIPVLIGFAQIDTLAETLRDGEKVFSGFAISFFRNGMSGDTLRFVFPVICALPYASAFVDEVKSGAVKSILSRSTRRRYLYGKILACMLSGALVLLCGLVLTAGLSMLVLSPWEQPAEDGITIIQLLKPLLPEVMLFLLSGALWAGVGMCTSCLVGSRYVAYLSPFIGYYLLIILYERYLPGWIIIYPKAWLSPGEGIPFGFWGNAAWVLELSIFVMLLFVHAAGRRLRNV